MPQKPEFFNLSLGQHVNQWLSIALISLMCFWVVLYNYVKQSEILGDQYAASVQLSE